MQFTEEQLLIRDMAKSFAKEQIKPRSGDQAASDSGLLPADTSGTLNTS